MIIVCKWVYDFDIKRILYSTASVYMAYIIVKEMWVIMLLNPLAYYIELNDCIIYGEIPLYAYNYYYFLNFLLYSNISFIEALIDFIL